MRGYLMPGGLRLHLRYPAERIRAEVERLAREISCDFAGETLLVVTVLKGAFFFAADLVRQLKIPVELDFVRLASYAGTASTGQVRLVKDLEIPVAGRHVLVVEDILDTGLTLACLLESIRNRAPRSLRVCTLIDKRERRRVDCPVDYAGITCAGGFLVGYGLDLDERFRELPDISEVGSQTPEGRTA